ncbi:hypothetical protein C474_02481 [Halogeometricum pallidum JCM 14848]|uniref:Uncharacterized protein n=1 Tax=Halogeometricum pallidum JCM 14848 TaxID=1227487 RepID=M0DGG4_HALPD|nr:hypothetical protein [Halogeometricum pallidum]ELZ34535.1 hypothetical protein C474_02481 [Halogeometricum pallidum JCM 14848]
MSDAPTDDRTRGEETVANESDGATRTDDAGEARTAGGTTVRDGTTDPEPDDEATRTDGRDDSHTGLLWFSAAGAAVLSLLWIIDVTGWFGLTWAVLGSTTTLALAIIAAVGAVLFWYDGSSGATAA